MNAQITHETSLFANVGYQRGEIVPLPPLRHLLTFVP